MAERLNDRVTLHCGDCLDVLDKLDQNSIDACVCDPPYHLQSITKRFAKTGRTDKTRTTSGPHQRTANGFMNQQWDGGDVAFRIDTWERVLRVLKPGGHLLSFGGTRTYHRMACAIEDAGFEIRDSISWNFGSGFPKSHNVGKNLDAKNARCTCDNSLRSLRQSSDDTSCLVQEGQNPDMLISMQRSIAREGMGSARAQGAQSAEPRELHQSGSQDDGATQSGMEGRGDLPSSSRQLREREIRPLPTGADVNGTQGRLHHGASAGNGALGRAPSHAGRVRPSRGSSSTQQRADESDALALQSQPQERGAWNHCGRCGKPMVPDGLGTALKPAMELICVARKPLSESTVAANVLKWGTGALNIDGCRVATTDQVECTGDGSRTGKYGGHGHGDATLTGETWKLPAQGRWPANVIHDGSDEVVGAFPATKSAGHIPRSGGTKAIWSNGREIQSDIGVNNAFADSGSAARFFYTAKADADDRLGSKHPTVKPLDLMQYLVRLVTPPRGLVLDPFAGTGTTGEACMREGMRALLIEREASYQDDIRRRMRLAASGNGERKRESIKAKNEGKPLDHGPLFGP